MFKPSSHSHNYLCLSKKPHSTPHHITITSPCSLVSAGKWLKVAGCCCLSYGRKDFLGERVVNYWNNLPSSVRLSSSVDMFKCNLEAYNYKLSSIDNRVQASTNCYWEVSEHVLSRIETPSALAGRSALCEYWSENPWVARKKGVNLFTSS